MNFRFFTCVITAAAVGISTLGAAESQQGWRAGLSFIDDGVLGTEGTLDSPEMGQFFRLGLAAAERSFATPGLDPREVTLIDRQVRASFDGVLGSHGSGSTKVTQHLVSSLSLGMTKAMFSEGESSRSFPFSSVRVGIHFELGKSILGTGVSLVHAYPTKKQENALESYGISYEKSSLSPYLTMGISFN